MRNDTEMGALALLLAGEMAGTAQAAPSYQVGHSDQLQSNPAAVVETSPRGTHPYPSLNAQATIVVAQAEVQDRPAIPTPTPTPTQYIGGELQQMNMR